MRHPTSLCDHVAFQSLLAIGLLFVGARAEAAKGDTTYTVDRKYTIGDIEVGVSAGGKKAVYTKVHVGLADDRPKIATNIAAAIGHGAAASGNKVTVPSGSDETSIRISVALSAAARTTMNIDGFSLGTQPAGTLFFAANPDSGNDVLDNDVLVSAGFVNGLADVSVAGTAGERITDLASALNTALDGAGYVTRLLDPLDIEVFATGALGPTELDFTVEPASATEDDGIVYGVQAAAVPEPDAGLLMLTGLAAGAMAARRRAGISGRR